MALAFSTTCRNNMLDEIAALVDGGAGAGLLRIYNGTRPASGGTATTLLAELTMSDPAFPAAAAAALTANAITDDASANASGTATWFRIVDSNGVFVIDGDVGTAGSDLNMNTVTITALGIVAVDSLVINAGNA